MFLLFAALFPGKAVDVREVVAVRRGFLDLVAPVVRKQTKAKGHVRKHKNPCEAFRLMDEVSQWLTCMARNGPSLLFPGCSGMRVRFQKSTTVGYLYPHACRDATRSLLPYSTAQHLLTLHTWWLPTG